MQFVLPQIFQHLLEPINQVAKELEVNLYLFGGFMRDILSKEMPEDVDVYVENISSIQFSNELILRGIIKKKKDLIGSIPFKEDIILVLSQTKIYDYDFDFVSSNLPSIEEYTKRVDFTINTLYYNLSNNELIDPTGYGVQDIKNKVLRINSGILTPIECLRAVKLAILYNYNISKETANIIRSFAVNIPKIKDEGVIIKILDKIYSVDKEGSELLLKNLGMYQYLEKYLS